MTNWICSKDLVLDSCLRVFTESVRECAIHSFNRSFIHSDSQPTNRTITYARPLNKLWMQQAPSPGLPSRCQRVPGRPDRTCPSSCTWRSACRAKRACAPRSCCPLSTKPPTQTPAMLLDCGCSFFSSAELSRIPRSLFGEGTASAGSAVIKVVLEAASTFSDLSRFFFSHLKVHKSLAVTTKFRHRRLSHLKDRLEWSSFLCAISQQIYNEKHKVPEVCG